MRPFELRDDRVLLSVPTRDDVDRLTDLCQDEQVQRWTTVPVPYRRRDADWFVRELVAPGWDNGQELTWAVRDPADHRVLGMIGLRLEGDGSAEVGFWLAAEARGRGLMSSAVRLVVAHGLEPGGLALARVLWYAHVGNWASRRVAWRAGFRFEGTVRSHLVQRGARRDAWVATLMRDDPREPSRTWFDVPVLRGDGLVLRRWRDSDADAIVEACTDPVTRHWLGGLPDPYTRETALGYIAGREEDHATGRGLHWAVALSDHGPAAGSFSLMGVDDAHGPGSAEVGYWVHQVARGKGVATEAVRLMIEHAFAPTEAGGLGLRRLVLAHAWGNDASAKVAFRNRFRHCGTERGAERLGDGSWADLHWYDLLATDPR
ncbi:MAG: GNAT family N-acetyltransferase [Jiangellaceae bacterium]